MAIMPSCPMHTLLSLLLVCVIGLTASAPTATDDYLPLYAYTGYKGQSDEKTTLLRMSPRSGHVERVVNFDRGVPSKGGSSRTCLAGQDAHFASSPSQGLIFGATQTTVDDTPILIHDVRTNKTWCDDGVEDIWGLTMLDTPSASSTRFVAVRGDIGPWNQWRLSVGTVTVTNAEGAGTVTAAATFKEELTWAGNGSSTDADLVLCMETVPGVVAVDGARHDVFVACGGGHLSPEWQKPWRIWTFHADDGGWRAAGAHDVSPDLGSISALGWSDKHGAIAIVSRNVTDSAAAPRLGFLDPHTGTWKRSAPTPVSVPLSGGSSVQATAFDASTETAYALLSGSQLLTIDMAAGKVSRSVKLSRDLAVTDMVFLPTSKQQQQQA